MKCPICKKEVDKIVPVLIEGHINKELKERCKNCALKTITTNRGTWIKSMNYLEETKPFRGSYKSP